MNSIMEIFTRTHTYNANRRKSKRVFINKQVSFK